MARRKFLTRNIVYYLMLSTKCTAMSDFDERTAIYSMYPTEQPIQNAGSQPGMLFSFFSTEIS